MRFVMFYHSMISDWNHGNAHFLRGVVSELQYRGHDVQVFEPMDGWSLTNLIRHHGEAAIDGFRRAFPNLKPAFYDPGAPDLDRILDGANIVIVHEWNSPELIRAIGQRRASGGRFRLLFHDTHHRSISDRDTIAGLALDHYDGILAFGEVIRQMYLKRGWAARAWTWHEAADTSIFAPSRDTPRASKAPRESGDLVWIGNWGDDERSAELIEYLVKPAHALKLRTLVHGVRYPRHALHTLKRHGISHQGWLPNHQVPEVYSGHKCTVHVPRRPYTEALEGIPTIRVFEALACGIPLICAPWNDTENLFTPGQDYLVANTGEEMQQHLKALTSDPELANALRTHGLATIRNHHTCAHRVDQLLRICSELGPQRGRAKARGAS